MRMFKKDEGFTLVELMVVVLIIGILVAIAIPVFNNASASAKLKTCQANQRTIEGSVQQYLAANPTVTWAAELVNAGSTLVSGGYLKQAPTCPGTGGGTYYVDGTGTVVGDTGAAAAGFIAGHSHF